MSVHCDIIKDLLPLYVDNVCSTKSKEVIEMHLLNCEDCKREVLAMNADIPFIKIEENLNAAKNVNKISKKWKREMRKYLFEGMIIAAIIMMLFLILSVFVGIDSTPAIR